MLPPPSTNVETPRNAQKAIIFCAKRRQLLPGWGQREEQGKEGRAPLENDRGKRWLDHCVFARTAALRRAASVYRLAVQVSV